MIRIVTDSSCDLPAEAIDAGRIIVVPLTIRFGDEEFIDRAEISVDDFWARMEDAAALPETATPSVGRFHQAYRDLVSEGADGIVAVCLSGRLSGTAQSARIAAEHVTAGVPIRVVDTGLVSLALGLVVATAAEAAAAGAPIDAVEQATNDAARATRLFAVLDTLDHLRRGGRIGGAAAFVGDLLRVKPLVTLLEGELAAAGRTRTKKRAVAAIIDHVAEAGDEIDRIGVFHSGHESVDEVVAAVDDLVEPTPMLARLGPVVGTHAGPGTLGVAYRLR
jgi:DegV family protein with EDD domain